MVKVRIRFRKDSILADAKGHTLFDKKGKDILCASVSVLLQGWVLGLAELCGADVKVEKKSGEFSSVLGRYGEKEALLTESLILSLRVLEKDHPGHITVQVEESNGS